jgi:hypothetical protein
VIQDGDREKTFRFPVGDFDRVAEIVRPVRRRPPESAAHLRSAGLRTRFGDRQALRTAEAGRTRLSRQRAV